MRRLLLVLCCLVAAPAAARERYPARWWQPVTDPHKPAWEILPQEAGPGEVILSKRNDLGLLSNFAATPFVLDGVRYASVEGFWQAMYYPEGPPDPEKDPRWRGMPWPHTRPEVAAMSSFQAKEAGNAAKAILAKLGIDWISYKGRRLFHKGADQQAHYDLICRAMLAKAEQNPAVRDVLLATGDLVLRPDHTQPPDRTPAYAYHRIWMEIRTRLRTEERRLADKALSHYAPENRARILAAVEAARWQPARAAVFDADGTLWHADMPREFLQFQIARRRLRYFDYAEDAARAVERLYGTCRSEVAICIAQAAYLHVGLTEQELARDMAAFVSETGFAGRIFPGQQQLVRYLRERGFQIYVVSGGPRWLTAYAAGRYFGIDASHVIGVHTRVAAGTLTAEVIPPVPFREGKMKAMAEQIREEILIAAGNTGSDVPMLERATLLPIAVHSFGPETPGFHYPAEQELLKQARARGWLIQKFTVTRPEKPPGPGGAGAR